MMLFNMDSDVFIIVLWKYKADLIFSHDGYII